MMKVGNEPTAGISLKKRTVNSSYARLRIGGTGKYILWAALFYAAIVATIFFFFDTNEIVNHIQLVDFFSIFLAIAFVSMHFLIRTVRWHWLSMRFQLSVPFSTNALIYLSAFPMTVTPGKLGEVLRAWLLKRIHGVPMRRGVSVVISDRVLDLLALLLITTTGFWLVPQYFWITVTAGFLCVMIIGVILKPSINRNLVRAAYRIVGLRWSRVFAKLQTMFKTLLILKSSGVILPALALSLAGWMLEGSALTYILSGLGVEVPFFEVIVIFAIASLAGSLVLLPGGLGGMEATMIALFVLVGVEATAALVVTIFFRGITLWYAVLVGFLPFAWAAKRLAK